MDKNYRFMGGDEPEISDHAGAEPVPVERRRDKHWDYNHYTRWGNFTWFIYRLRRNLTTMWRKFLVCHLSK